jgi:AcrR family transcriptional regulator
MPRTPEQFEEIRSEKRRLIMDIALELFANQGYTSTSMSQIAQKADISKGLIYNYFTSKEALLNNIMNELAYEINDMINPDHDGEITADEARQFIDVYFSMLKNRREQLKLYFQLSMQPQVLGLILGDQADPSIYRQQELLYSFLLKQTTVDPTIALVNISSLIKGFSMQYVFAPEKFPDEFMEKYKLFLKGLLIK